MTSFKGGWTMEELDPKFKIRAPLRCDGIGRLDCAENVESGKRMAIRWLPLEVNGDAAARALQKLPEHPTLPKVYQTGRVGASAYVAIDFPEGRLLSTMLGEAIPVENLCRMGAEIADALATIHADGMVHGEISAESFLLLPNGKAILWDMPLVIADRLTDRRGERRQMAHLVGMAPFLPPERAQGKRATAASDVYSLAAVLCAAAQPHQPEAETTLAIVHQLATGKWTPRVPEAFPPGTRAALSQMLSREPELRPTASEAAALLSGRSPENQPAPRRPGGPVAAHWAPTIPEMQAVQFEPSVVLPPDLQAEAEVLAFNTAQVRRRPLRIAALALAGVVLVAAAISLPLMSRRPESAVGQAKAEAVAPAESAPPSAPVVVRFEPVEPVARKPVPARPARKPEKERVPRPEDFGSLLEGTSLAQPETDLKRPSL